ncbi:MAG: hypothetical protein KF735_07025 [Chelatococcus sp.]|jgi:hypothetical protein|uniref:hypothetical protein n=1 Tax=unclassified Chelatococcus TaxID=2638111 RepID=UPI001BD12AC6|nr:MULTISPECIES: hypothetical protein [unclassified Chelatococcus]CAH1669394.1 conserved hypothetical protein [Hyphomicrobiales bacterium]MBS7739340.1 hypothetical protein [Chelatococcus sp. HY11]MBX3537369.1 hypothetical protein [Chelatococcus sp.]MBX3546619.1 hypothetical protein [Chelatococcus sp.]MCO5076125.1 hypothetical protein [Chelatococcus sp.]
MDQIAGTQLGQVVQLADQAAFKYRMRRPAVRSDKPAQLLLFMGVHYERHETPARNLPRRGKRQAPQRDKNVC